MRLAICCPATYDAQDAVANWQLMASHPLDITVDATVEGEGAGYLQKVQKFYLAEHADVLGYLHSDLTIHEQGWDNLVLKEFENEQVGIVSFCGAKRHGSPDIYKVLYDYRQLARYDFISNLTDATTHGRRVLEATDVAVVDSFSLFIRRNFLSRCGGWPVDDYPPSHCSDYWACLMAHRLGYTVRYVPVACTHTSGGVRGNGAFDYAEWIAGTRWDSDEECHRIGHELLYDQFRDVLPVVIP